MKKLLLLLLIVELFGAVGVTAAAPTFGPFEEVVASTAGFANVTAALEKGITSSSFKLLGSWGCAPPDAGPNYHVRVYVLHDPDYTTAIGKYDGPHAAAAVLRINVYETAGQKAVQINIVNPETMARVYLYQHGIDDAGFQNLLTMAAGERQKLEDLITGSVQGTVLKQQSGPLRAEADLLGYVGDGDAKVMTNFSDYAADYANGVIKTFDSFTAATQWAEDHIKNNAEGWKLVATLDVGSSRYYGISKADVEATSAKILGASLGASADNPVPGINHDGAYPMDVLIYNNAGTVTLAFPGQMWRMMFYYWDAGIGAFVQYQTLPGEYDASLLKALGG